jgi:hypothetical protein
MEVVDGELEEVENSGEKILRKKGMRIFFFFFLSGEVAENLVGVRGYFVVVVRWVCLVVCGGFWLLVVQISTVVLLFRFPVVLFSIPRQQLVFLVRNNNSEK